MDKKFKIGDFLFRLVCPPEILPPENFLKFAWEEGADQETAPEYTYYIEVTDHLPQPEGKVLARRPDLLVFQSETGESRLIGVKGTEGYYACYQEVASDKARVLLARDRIQGLHIDPVFTSLLALERRLIARDSLILHCAYMVYQGEAILFSAPSETGKTTQANLWEKYRGSRTVNGDRALLGKRKGRWTAQGWPVCGTSEVCHNEEFPIRAVVMLSQAKENQGWPVCGTSEVCHNEEFPIRAVVMLSQAKENQAQQLPPGRAFPLLYSQITVNKWNMKDHLHAIDLIQELAEGVPVFHLGCTISEKAVDCLEKALKKLDG